MKYQNELDMVIHEMAEDLYKEGLIDDAKMREFDEACLMLEPEPVAEAVAVE